jgi:hypothetical protein
MFPLNEDDVLDDVHDYFAAFGFFCEILFIFFVWLDVYFAPSHIEIPFVCRLVTNCGLALLIAALLMFFVGYSIGDNASDPTAANFYESYEIICEYLIGLTLIVVLKTIEYTGVYPLPNLYDYCLPAWMKEEEKVLSFVDKDDDINTSNSI